MRSKTDEECVRPEYPDSSYRMVRTTQDRQAGILDQVALGTSRVQVDVDGLLAEFIAAGIAGLGIGFAGFRSEGKPRFMDAQEKGMEKRPLAEHLAARAAKIFTCRGRSYVAGSIEEPMVRIAPLEDVAQNDGRDGTPTILVDGGIDARVMFGTGPSPGEEATPVDREDVLGSMFAAAVGLDYFRHMRSYDKHDLVLEPGDMIRRSFAETVRGLRALVVGGGAIGTFVGLGAALDGYVQVDIVDDDRIEETNLNRQVLYHGAEGEYKATVLARRLGEIGVESTPIVTRLDRQNVDMMDGYDVVFGCVDNIETRRVLNSRAVERELFYIDGATSAFSAMVVAYMPGKNRCVACRRPMGDVPRASCMSAEPSVIIPNMVAAALMLDQARRKEVLDDQVLRYDSRACRIGATRFLYGNGCNCRTARREGC